MSFLDKFGEFWKRAKAKVTGVEVPAPTDANGPVVIKDLWEHASIEAIAMAKSEAKSWKRIGHRFGGREGKRHWIKQRAMAIAQELLADPVEGDRLRYEVKVIKEKRAERQEKKNERLSAINSGKKEVVAA